MIDVTYIDHMGSDLTVVNAARVSFGKKSEYIYSGVDTNGPLEKALHQRDVKLIRYLAKHKHISPFGHAFASFHVKAPVFVARQLVKHKFLRWNEISRRYVDDEPEFYMPDVWRGRSADKKQGSSGEVKIEDYALLATGRYKCEVIPAPTKPAYNTYGEIDNVYDQMMGLYDGLLKMGVAPEQARMVLPQSMMTEWYWSGSLDAFASMCHLRCKQDTQLETRLVAEQIDDKMAELFPVSWEALRTYEE